VKIQSRPLALILSVACMSSKWLVLAAIDEYRAEISPIKGFHCAYSTLHGGPTCSAYGREVIRERGLLRGGLLLLQRFRECHTARGLLLAGAARTALPPTLVERARPKPRSGRETARQRIAGIARAAF
jgi:putative component of membrane protein insertase Oxa1/YidC/SpoIIIJ protein YidD